MDPMDFSKKPDPYYKKYSSCNACSPPEDQNKKTCDPDTFLTMGYCPQGTEINCKDLPQDLSSGKTLTYGHACPHMMMGSSAMIAAAEKDGLGEKYMYAVVGHDINSSFPPDANLSILEGCGQCYELEFHDDRPSIIAQNFNTAAPGPNDVNFDLYMAVGGYGAFNSCFPDRNTNLDEHDQTVFGTKVYKQYPGDDNPVPAKTIDETTGLLVDTQIMTQEVWSNGGLRGSPEMNDPRKAQEMQNNESGGPWITDDAVCEQLIGVSDTVTRFARESCRATFQSGVHFNGNSDKMGLKRVRRTNCPANLQHVTGLRRNPDPSLPNVGSDSDNEKGWFDGCTDNCESDVPVDTGCSTHQDCSIKYDDVRVRCVDNQCQFPAKDVCLISSGDECMVGFNEEDSYCHVSAEQCENDCGGIWAKFACDAPNDDNVPKPSDKIVIGVTTMEDCCQPTCAQVNNVDCGPNGCEEGYDAMYTCDNKGNIM